MLEGLVEDGLNVLVVQAVDGVPSLSCDPDQPGGLEDPQLVGHRRLAHAKPLRQVGDAHARLGQAPEDPDPGCISEDPE